MKRRMIFVLSAVVFALLLSSCSASMNTESEPDATPGQHDGLYNNYSNEGAADKSFSTADNENPPNNAEGYADGYTAIVENPYTNTSAESVSTFSADVDTASYAFFRSLVNNGYLSEQIAQYYASSFRAEEFLNYFTYEAKCPDNGELFGVTASVIPTPWNEQSSLLRVTLQAENAVMSQGNNLVFLIDVSGSMSGEYKLGLIKKTFSVLIDNLTENDRVSIVTYSGWEETVLTGCPGNNRMQILDAVNKLVANGSTNGQAGLERAYSVAKDYFIEDGNNRIIMASDGDLNVGISSAEELKAFVETKRNEGIYLSVLGFGMGNYKDDRMEALADCGNGVYYYIDGESEAEKVFGTDLLSTLYTVANDVKLQLTFNPDYVSAYRLIGYENRVMSKEDFNNDTKDAGEVGAGHQVTVFYELKLTEASEATANGADWAKLSIRYKRIGETVSVLNEYNIGARDKCEPNEDLTFMTAVIGSVMVLRNSEYKGSWTMNDVMNTLNGLNLSGYPDRAEFRNILNKLNAQ